MTHKELERLYKGHIRESSILCIDSHNSYIKFAIDFNLDHKHIKTKNFIVQSNVAYAYTKIKDFKLRTPQFM